MRYGQGLPVLAIEDHAANALESVLVRSPMLLN
jgi:hypothetical protein